MKIVDTVKKLLFLAGLAMTLTGAAQSRNVLFIGNSYTEVNNLPLLIQQAARSAGYDITYQSNTPGGCTFRQHCSNASMDLIRQGGWDVVVLQEQSQYPAFPQNQVEEEVFPYAQRLVDTVRAYNANCTPLFYMTWGRRDGDQMNASEFPVLGTYWGMDSMLYERYMQMKQDNAAAVCPVGRVWRYIRTNHPDIELYDGDGSHPSMTGSYAAACAFFVMLFGQPAANITFGSTLEPSTAALIRRVTDSVVYNHLNLWRVADTTTVDTTMPSDEGVLSVDAEDPVLVYPNPVINQVTLECPRPTFCSLYDIFGRCRASFTLVAGRNGFALPPLESGIYCLRCGRKSYKLTKQ